jgi:hypothetical protein
MINQWIFNNYWVILLKHTQASWDTYSCIFLNFCSITQHLFSNFFSPPLTCLLRSVHYLVPLPLHPFLRSTSTSTSIPFRRHIFMFGLISHGVCHIDQIMRVLQGFLFQSLFQIHVLLMILFVEVFVVWCILLLRILKHSISIGEKNHPILLVRGLVDV